MANKGHAKRIREFVETMGQVTYHDVVTYFKDTIPRGTISSTLSGDVKRGFMRLTQQDNGVWVYGLSSEAIDSPLLPKKDPRKRSHTRTPLPLEPIAKVSNGSYEQKLVASFSVVTVKIIVQDEDLNMHSMLNEIKDFPEVVDAKAVTVDELDPEEAVVTVRWRRSVKQS